MYINEALTYISMFSSAAFYCGFDTSLKEKTLGYLNATQASTFKTECEYTDCFARLVKLYDSDNGKITGEGFLTILAIIYNFDSAMIQKMKGELKRCLPDVNQKIKPVQKCDKFHTGISLLQTCLNTGKIEINHELPPEWRIFFKAVFDYVLNKIFHY